MWIKYEKNLIKVDYITLVEKDNKYTIQTMFDKYTIILGDYTKKKALEVYNEIVKSIENNVPLYEMP